MQSKSKWGTCQQQGGRRYNSVSGCTQRGQLSADHAKRHVAANPEVRHGDGRWKRHAWNEGDEFEWSFWSCGRRVVEFAKEEEKEIKFEDQLIIGTISDGHSQGRQWQKGEYKHIHNIAATPHTNVCHPTKPHRIFHQLFSCGGGRGPGLLNNSKPAPTDADGREDIRAKLVKQGIPPNPGPDNKIVPWPRCGDLCGTLCCTNCPHSIANEDGLVPALDPHTQDQHVQSNLKQTNPAHNKKRKSRYVPSAEQIIQGQYARFPCVEAEAQKKGSKVASKTSNSSASKSEAFKLIICNVSHLLNNIHLLKGRSFTAAAITEHSLPHKEYPELKKQLGKGYKSHISGLDPEKDKYVGGTACVLRSNNKHLVQPKPMHKQMQALNNQGRVGMYLYEICTGVHCLTYVVYGWTGADTDHQAACRTDDLLCIIHQDMMMQQDGPKLIVGDLNGSLATFVAFYEIVRSNQLYDIGAMASAFGGKNNDTTCKANGKAKATRRDYVIANWQARQMIDTIVVDHKPCFLVHDVIELTFKGKAPVITQQAVNMPTSLKSIVKKVLDKDYGEQNILRAQQQTAKKEEAQGKVFTCEPQLVDAEDKQTTPVFPTRSKYHSDDLELIEQTDKACEDFINDALDNEDAAKYTSAQKQAVYTRLHVIMDQHLDTLKGRWHKWLANKDMDRFFKNFSRCIEAAAVEFGNLQCSTNLYKGRGAVNIREVTETISTSCCSDVGGVVAPLTKEGERLLKQSRRITALRNNIHSLNKCKHNGDPENKVHTLQARVKEAIDNIQKDAKKNDGLGDVRRGTDTNNFEHIPSYFTLTKISEDLSTRALKLNKHAVKIDKKTCKVNLRLQGAHKNVTAAMKGQKPAPMSHLSIPETIGPGKEKGTTATDPHEVDAILHSVWDKITWGNFDDPKKDALAFCATYYKHIFHAQEHQIHDIQAQDLKNQCKYDIQSAPGLDGWAAADLELLSDKAYQLLADMLNTIEMGAPWPKAMLATRAVFLAKDENDTQNPLAYRILKITSGLYRKWGSLRMRQLQSWVELWDDEALHAGVPGKGAIDGSLKTALQVEQAMANHKLVAGGSIDVYKCFDQINRQLIYLLAEKAGMPMRILNAYSSYLENMEVRFQVGGTIGTPYHDRASIPQGCPFSMAMVALLTRPWISLMRQTGVIPRCLADDLLILAIGNKHQSRYIQAMNQSKQYFQDIGAKIAERKCFSFAADRQTRDFLSKYVWDHTGLRIPTVSSFRDIGAHLNLSRASNGVTLTKRMLKAIAMVKKLAWLPIPVAFKEKIVRANILPAGLYAVETTTVNNSTLRMLRAAIANAIGPKSTRASTDMVFNCTACSGDLDPLVYIMVQRVTALKRIMAKFPETVPIIRDIIHYCNHKSPSDVDSAGPVSLLQQDLKDLGAGLSDSFVITMDNEADIDIINMPWQHLKKAVADLVIRKRNKQAAQQRSHINGMQEMDNQMARKIVNKLGPKEQKVYRHVATGGAWADSHLASIGKSDGCCPHCGKSVDDMTHILWDCEEIHKHRKLRDLCGLDHSQLPTHIKHGIPSAMTTDVQGPYWSNHENGNQIGNNKQYCKDIGLRTERNNANIASCKYQEVKDQFSQAGIDCTQQNARQAFSNIKAIKEPPHFALPNKCSVAAPHDINVYSDGSWLYPMNQFLGLGGAGVWWPGRDINVSHRLSPAERELGHHQQHTDGLSLHTPIGGLSGSSTRTELAAAILALAANGPIHLGTDSQAFMDRANKVINNIRKGCKRKRHWQMTSDGDLWYHFEHAVKAKGWKSVRISKVKGHVRQQQVDEGRYTQADKDGNDKADEAADVAVSLHGEGIISVGKTLYDRYKGYLKFMGKVVPHIIEAYLIHRSILERADKDAPKEPKEFGYKSLPINEKQPDQQLIMQGSINNFRAFKGRHSCAPEVWHFLKNLNLYSTENDHYATTWLELYILYRMHNNPKPIPDNVHKARERATVQAQLNEFKMVTRGVIQRACYDDGQKNLFKPLKTKRDKFGGLAIKGRFAILSCGVQLDPKMAQVLEHNLITLSRQIAASKVEQFKGNKINLVPVTIKLKGRAGWDSAIKLADKDHQPHNDLQIAVQKPSHGTKRPHDEVHFTCPRCKATSNSNKSCFQLQDLDRVCKCNSCKSNVKVRDWLCSCSHNWHLCEVHRSLCSSKQITKPLSNGPGQSSKRMLGPLSNEQLQEIDVKRMRRSNKHLLDPSPNILSANLRERFAYLFNG